MRRLLSANPVTQIVGPTATQATYALEKQKLGLSASLLSQPGTFFGNIFHGSFGTSNYSARHLPSSRPRPIRDGHQARIGPCGAAGERR